MNITLDPHTPAELAAALRSAAADGCLLTPMGAGTLQHLGRASAPAALPLDTRALSRVVEYIPPDMTITLEAGITLAEVQARLREHGQWLPWAPPAPAHATIGGLLAAGVGGPLRLGYGTPRDWVLGMRVALGDGRLVQSGGKVVKNVAGYDTHKLHIGALGTLGVIAEATFKLAPLPEQTSTLLFACADVPAACALAERLRARPLAPASLLIHHSEQGSPAQLLAQFAGVAAAVARQQQIATAAAHELGAALGDTAEAAARWDALVRFAHPSYAHAASSELALRAGAPPGALAQLVAALERAAPPGRGVQALAYAGVGLAYARWQPAPAAVLAEAIERLRGQVRALGGYVVVEDAPAAVRAELEVWDAPPATLAQMRALKQRWDPQGILNRGRYVGGI